MKNVIQDIKHAMELHAKHEFREAEAGYRHILLDHPNEPFVLHLLGMLQTQTGLLEEGIENLEAALSIGMPRFEWYPPAIDANITLGRNERALHWQQIALALRPTWADGYYRLSELLVALGRTEQAIEALKRTLALGAKDPAACQNNLGVSYHHLRQYQQAVLAYQQAIAIKPTFAVAHRNLGDACRQLGDYASAESSYRTAVSHDSRLADAYNGIGLTFYLRDRFTEAVSHFEIANRINPANTAPSINLVLCYGRLGEIEKLEETIRKTMVYAPSDATMSSALVMVMNYTHGHELPAVLNESLGFSQRHELPLKSQIKPSNPQDLPDKSDRKIRIGYISPDFKSHPVAIFLEPLLKHHDRSRFTIACYSNVERTDEVTERLKSYADVWRDIAGRSDDDVAEQIRADQIDILIDLAGHTVDNRLLVLARKPAPVQMTWMGYPNTTGLSSIDYRITDVLADPIGVEPYYTEKLIRLPDAFFVYEPPKITCPVSPLPMLDRGYITFGSFNNITKITRQMGRLWSAILQAVPNARLVMAMIPPDAKARILSLLSGIAVDRIEFPQTTAFKQFLELHHQVDVALDTFPYVGHTTTCNCIWMGVPMVSLAGPTAVSRVGATILINLGLADQCLAATEQDYVAKAVSWANRPAELAILRTELRGGLERSSLTDAPRFARHFESALSAAIGRT